MIQKWNTASSLDVGSFNPLPVSGILFRKKHIPRLKKLASLSVWRLRPDWSEVRFGMTPHGPRELARWLQCPR